MGTPYQNPVLFTVTFTGAFNFSRPVVISNHTNPNVSALRTTVLNSANTSGTQEWSNVISGNGGFIRNGDGGTTVLSGANSYTGNTTIDAGTLSITSPFLADTADVLFVTTSSGSPLLNLNFSGTDTIDQLFIDGVAQATGTYDASHPSGLFSGAGALLVTAMGSSPGAVPEPGTLVLAMITVFTFGGLRRRRGSL
jgi:fibronectin-binding autotransporter adhesin